MNEGTPNYFAVIPADVRYDDQIPANAKLLYGEISALINDKGFCHASNQYFANVYGMAEDTITRLISKLENAGYIVRELERDNTGQVVRRKLYLKVSVPDEHPLGNLSGTSRIKNREGTGQKVGKTNTSNTDIEKENKKRKSENKKQGKGHVSETDFDPLPLFVGWIGSVFPNESPQRKNELYYALLRLNQNRVAMKKPMLSQNAVTALCNKLQRYSKENADPLGCMIDLLDTAVSSNWQTVYPPKGVAILEGQKPGGRVYECL